MWLRRRGPLFVGDFRQFFPDYIRKSFEINLYRVEHTHEKKNIVLKLIVSIFNP